MSILFLRYGRQKLDNMLEEIFGTSDIHSGKELSLTDFLHSLHLSQIKQLKSKPAATAVKGR